jgi:MtN3 and saliva related transmembrane protein
MSSLQLLGLAAGTITSITFLPQVIQIWKTKSAKDISMFMLVLLMIGVSMWLTYGILVMDAAIIYTNSMVLTMSLIMLFFKLKFRKSDGRN